MTLLDRTFPWRKAGVNRLWAFPPQAAWSQPAWRAEADFPDWWRQGLREGAWGPLGCLPVPGSPADCILGTCLRRIPKLCMVVEHRRRQLTGDGVASLHGEEKRRNSQLRRRPGGVPGACHHSVYGGDWRRHSYQSQAGGGRGVLVAGGGWKGCLSLQAAPSLQQTPLAWRTQKARKRRQPQVRSMSVGMQLPWHGTL